MFIYQNAVIDNINTPTWNGQTAGKLAKSVV